MSGLSLYQRYIQPVEDQMIRSIWRIVRDPDDADDAMQNALETIWKRFERVRSHPNPRALILRICVNSACDLLRRKHRQNRHRVFDGDEDRFVETAPSASQTMEANELEREIIGAIGRLPDNQSVALLMRIVQDCPYCEIADAMECSESTVRGYLSQGRAALSQRLSHLNPHTQKEVSP